MMKQFAVYASALLIVLTPLLIVPGCSNKSSDDDLIGNWLISYDFGGATRSEAVTFTIGDNVYVATGQGLRTKYADIYSFNLTNSYWSKLNAMPANAGVRSNAVGFAVSGKGYVATGINDDGYLADVWEYNPTSNTWTVDGSGNTTKKAFPGGARRDAIAFTIGTKAYVGTGFDDSYLGDLYEYDPAADSWTRRADIFSKRCASTVFVYNNLAYVVSGESNGVAANDIRVFNPSTNTWDDKKRKITSISDESYDDKYTSIARYNAVSYVVGTKAYLATGTSGSLMSTVWEYDIPTDLWKQKTSFSGTAREGAISFVLGTRGFVATGRSGTQPYENVYEFQPDATDDDTDNN